MTFSFSCSRPVFTLAAALLISFSSLAKAQVVEFRGGGFLSDFSEDCAPFFAPDNRVYINVRYRPANLGSNGTNSELAFSNEFFWQTTFELQDGSFSEEWSRAQGFHGGIITLRTRPAPFLRDRQQDPATLTNQSQDVYIQGQVRHMFQRGCRASYNIALIRRP
ncbi:MAG: hypothetical protein ACK4NW_09000 [Roseinatronobacter sp.]